MGKRRTTGKRKREEVRPDCEAVVEYLLVEAEEVRHDCEAVVEDLLVEAQEVRPNCEAVVEDLLVEAEEVRPNCEAVVEDGAEEVDPHSEAVVEKVEAEEALVVDEAWLRPTVATQVENPHLCTSFCDLLIAATSPRYSPSSCTDDVNTDRKFQYQMEYALQKCEPKHCNDAEDTYLVELRGIVAPFIGYTLMRNLCHFSRTSVKHLHFVVGCKAHGSGRGYVQEMVCSLLKTDKTIEYHCNIDSIVCVEIEKDKDYTSIPMWPLLPSSRMPLDYAGVVAFVDLIPAWDILDLDEDSSDSGFLCTVVCDFFAGCEKKPWNDGWKEIHAEVLNCLHECSSEFRGGGLDSSIDLRIDLRGLFRDEVKIKLTDLLNCQSSPPYLNVIVGCTLHGIGDGKLSKFVLEFLKLNPSMYSSFVVNNSIVTIKLCDKRDFATRISQPLPQPRPDASEDDDIGVSHEVPEVKVRLENNDSSAFLCTFVCDFLLDLPKFPGQWWDKKTTLKILAGLENCYRSVSKQEDVEETLSVDIRGQYVDQAIEEILTNLRLKPTLKYLNLIVGCKEHGIGNGKLKDAISDFLLRLDIPCVLNKEPFVISIEVGKVDMPRIHEMTSEMMVPHSTSVDSSDYSGPPEVFLCTILCDLLFDVPTEFLESWDPKLVNEVRKALRLCDTSICSLEELDEGTYTTDLRGVPARDSEWVLVENLISWRSYLEKINFVVGCTTHGSGEGKLGDMVCGVLGRDTTINWNRVGDAVISVDLDPEHDYSSLRLKNF